MAVPPPNRNRNGKLDRMLWLGEGVGDIRQSMCGPVYSATDWNDCVNFLRKSLYCHSAFLQIEVEIGKPQGQNALNG